MARTRAALEAPARPALPSAPSAPSAGADDSENEGPEEAPVTPFGVFNPLEEEGSPLW